MSLSVTERKEFEVLRHKIEEDYRKNFIQAYVISGGNVSKLALGLCLSRCTVHKYLNKNFGKQYKTVLLGYSKCEAN